MANDEQSDRPIRPRPQVHDENEAARQEAACRRAPTPNEVSEETVAEIAEEAEARARR